MQILHSNFPLKWNTCGGPTRHYKPPSGISRGSRLLLTDWQLGNNPEYYEHRLEDPTNPIHTCKTLATYDPNMGVSDTDSQGYKYRPCTCVVSDSSFQHQCSACVWITAWGPYIQQPNHQVYGDPRSYINRVMEIGYLGVQKNLLKFLCHIGYGKRN